MSLFRVVPCPLAAVGPSGCRPAFQPELAAVLVRIARDRRRKEHARSLVTSVRTVRGAFGGAADYAMATTVDVVSALLSCFSPPPPPSF